MPVYHVIGNMRHRVITPSRGSGVFKKGRWRKPHHQWFAGWMMLGKSLRRSKRLCGSYRMMDEKRWGYGYWYKEIIGPFGTADELLEALHDGE